MVVTIIISNSVTHSFMANANPQMAKASAFIFMIVIGVGGAWMYGNYQKATNEEAQQALSAPHRNPSNSITISVIDLYEKYKENGLLFEQNYVDKTVTANGTIQSIDKHTIVRDDVSISFGYTSCNLEPSENDKALQLTAGSPVTVQGIVTSTVVGFSLEECVILP